MPQALQRVLAASMVVKACPAQRAHPADGTHVPSGPEATVAAHTLREVLWWVDPVRIRRTRYWRAFLTSLLAPALEPSTGLPAFRDLDQSNDPWGTFKDRLQERLNRILARGAHSLKERDRWFPTPFNQGRGFVGHVVEDLVDRLSFSHLGAAPLEHDSRSALT